MLQKYLFDQKTSYSDITTVQNQNTVKLGDNKLGYNEQNIHSQMTIYYTNYPGDNDPRL